ncbi:DUF6232 family protein [Phytohabitans houttuyneae]|uniref:Uncharacterized protein n=1 Tax=Phytohabitans houttuyneae TaxID=1076126 RepID=A0A6V8KGC5_9ACTN|nr:DUF6232 family protein [Phytohabitans houttuyneae]GFJ81448.1 hypothetical protein Phou_056280 [Phytohabitans houttuyneae]
MTVTQPDDAAAVVLYATPELVVTRQWIYTRGHRYRVADLEQVVRARGGLHPAAQGALVVAALDVTAAIPIMTMVGSLAGWAMAAVAVLVPCLVAVVSVYRWPPRQELWAYHRGCRVLLLKTRDGIVFGQVSRALQRAIESLPTRQR